MQDRFTDTAAPHTARIAGLLYLTIILCGVWSEAGVRAGLIVPGDATATAANILASSGLFRMAFAADTLMLLCDVALAVLLYRLFLLVSRTVALMAMAFRLVQSAVLGVNLLNHAAALLVLEQAQTAGAAVPADSAALALLLLEVHSLGYDAGLLFFGINSLLTGWLIARSGLFPAALGWAVAGAGLVYLTGSSLRFLAPQLSDGFAVAYLLPLAAESAFCLWLLLGRGGPGLSAAAPPRPGS